MIKGLLFIDVDGVIAKKYRRLLIVRLRLRVHS